MSEVIDGDDVNVCIDNDDDITGCYDDMETIMRKIFNEGVMGVMVKKKDDGHDDGDNQNYISQYFKYNS